MIAPDDLPRQPRCPTHLPRRPLKGLRVQIIHPEAGYDRVTWGLRIRALIRLGRSKPPALTPEMAAEAERRRRLTRDLYTEAKRRDSRWSAYRA